ncbi:MAG: SLBB domain-containing protein [bacterium]|nr:SLBB domain-containing protein [bacterium]
MILAGPDIRAMGVVGAGGAGFPTSVKAGSKVEFVIANGAECEPLVHKDVHVMERFAPQVIGGMRIMMALTGASKGYFGVKAKHKEAVEAIEAQLPGTGIEMSILGDFYPAGDEYELVYWATGRLIPPAGLPAAVGCIVDNVETLFNVFQASQNIPVIDKFVSVTGLVKQPSCFRVPLGTPLREVLEWAGGPSREDTAVYLNGLMMGRLIDNLDMPVTKTTGAMILLPADHPHVLKAKRTNDNMLRIGRASCDQCSRCTEMCPRHLLGYNVQPHRVMRGLGFTLSGSEVLNESAALCVACGLCSNYSCPEGLYPREACNKAKADLRAAGKRYVQPEPPRVHPMKESRRVPTSSLRRRLGVEPYDFETEFREIPAQPKKVRILLSQHIGKPCAPLVSEGMQVTRGMCIGTVPSDQLGVDIHASISGKVVKVTDSFIEIEG